MVVHSAKQRSGGVLEQAIEKRDEHLGIDAPLVHHEMKPTLGIDRRGHVGGEALARHRDAGRTPEGCPGRVGVVMRAHARLIDEEDPRPHALGLGRDGREGAAPNPRRTQLHCGPAELGSDLRGSPRT